MSIFLTVEQFASDYYMGSTGTKPSNAVQVAIDLAEGDISTALGYPIGDDGDPTFEAHTFVEEHPWPYPNRPITLNVPRIISLDEVLTLHDYGTCDCEWEELTACGFIYDAKYAIVRFRACAWVSGCWSHCGCQHRIRVTYTAGFAAADILSTTATGRRLRSAISLQARSHLELLNFYTDGDVAVRSFSSLGYSEARDFIRTAAGRKLGLSMLSQQAMDMLGPLLIRPQGPVILRGH